MAVLRLLLVAVAVGVANGHSTGGCTGSCNSLIPNHQPNPTNNKGGQAPYALSAPASAAAGQQLSIRISGGQFLGFMVRVLDSQGNSGGRFGSGSNYQGIQCQNPDDTATHRGPNTFNGIELPWLAPDVPGVYRIMATVVKSYDNFFTEYYTDVTVI